MTSMKEKMILVQRVTISMEKRFAEHADLQQTFLETVAYIYKDEAYTANSEFKIKLEIFLQDQSKFELTIVIYPKNNLRT